MNGILILYIILVVVLIILWNFYRSGKKALSIFPDIKTVNVVYRDKFATGHSVRSFRTTIGGANKTLDVVVTDHELWIRSMLFFAGIVQQYDLIHKIPLRRISNASREGSKVIVNFRPVKGESKQLVLVTKNPEEFLLAIFKLV